MTSLSVGDKPKLTIKHLHASLASKSPAASGEPGIAVGNDTTIEGAAIDGFGLIVTLAIPLFQRYDTLVEAADGGRRSAIREEIGRPSADEVGGTGQGRCAADRLLQSLRHDLRHHRQIDQMGRRSVSGATIDQHVVTVPDFGKIFFGELLITDLSRRLTMLRLELGSPIGGFVACAEVESNGTLVDLIAPA